MEQPSHHTKALRDVEDPDMVADGPSDFRDLVEIILRLDTATTSLLKDLGSFCDNQRPSCTNPNPTINKNISDTALDLERQYREHDTHYGWVLASDRLHVNKVLRSFVGKDMDGKEWFKEVSVRQIATRRLLGEIIERAEFVSTV